MPKSAAECPGGEEEFQTITQEAENEARYTRAPGRLAQPNNEGTPPPDPVTETIRARFLSRQRVGWTKYGIGLGRDDFTMDNWLQHLEEELMDALQYTVRLRMTLNKSLKVNGSAEDVKIEVELPAQEIARLIREMGGRQARVMQLVGAHSLAVDPLEEVVYSHVDCLFNVCPARMICEERKTCAHPLEK